MKLIIAEKPSVAKEIAQVVGAEQKHDGYLQGREYYVSWCNGHLLELARPEAYDATLKKWNLEALPIVPSPFQHKVSSKTADQYKILKTLMNAQDVDILICATDAGREGELIFRNLYNQTGCKKPWRRLWLTSMAPAAIRSALNTMKNGHDYDNLYAAALCRQQADWLMGINLTRLYTVKYHELLNTGRVQTPTIQMLIQRQMEIWDFTPTPYYTVTAHLKDTDCDFSVSCNCEERERAEQLLNAGKDAGELTIQSVEVEKKGRKPPKLYDLTSLQREANRLLGYTAQQTVDIVQGLYESKLCTYPRTDSKFLPADMFDRTAQLLETLSSNFMECSQILNPAQLINDSEVTDHHAIIPTEALTLESLQRLPEPEKRVLQLIVYRTLAAASESYVVAVTTVAAELDEQVLLAKGKTVETLGYAEITEDMRSAMQIKGNGHRESILPERIEAGKTYPIQDVEIEKKETTAPVSHTEDTLLGAMEAVQGGLGTPATRAAVIENIISNGFVQREKKYLIPTEKAWKFMSVVNPDMKSPELTAVWDRLLTDIENGYGSPEQFLADVCQKLAEVVNAEKESADKAELFAKEPETIGNCPCCRKIVIERPKSYSCSANCGFLIWKNISGKSLYESDIKALLEKGKTKLLGGFKSKAGKPFSAYLLLQDGKVSFEFSKKKG